MRKHFFTYISLFLIPCCLFALEDAWNPACDPTNGWDWINTDRDGKSWWTEAGLPNPFRSTDFYTGIRLNDPSAYHPSHGWELYVRRIFIDDANLQPSINASGSRQYMPDANGIYPSNQFTRLPSNVLLKRPFFILYNKYSGVLRYFVYRGDGTGTNPAEGIKAEIFVNGTDGKIFNKHGFFLGANGLSLEDIGTGLPIDKSKLTFLTTCVTDNWYVFDAKLNYDPNNYFGQNIKLTFRVDFYIFNTSKLTMGGSFISPRTQYVAANGALNTPLAATSAPAASPNEFFNSIGSAFGKLDKTIGEAGQSELNKLAEPGKNTVKTLFDWNTTVIEKDLAFDNFIGLVPNALKSAAPLFALQGFVSLFVDALGTNTTNGGYVKVGWDTSYINMNGALEIIQQDPWGHFEIGVAGSWPGSLSGDIPYFSKTHDKETKLGLYTMIYRPKMRISSKKYKEQAHQWEELVCSSSCGSGCSVQQRETKYVIHRHYASTINPRNSLIVNPLVKDQLELQPLLGGPSLDIRQNISCLQGSSRGPVSNGTSYSYEYPIRIGTINSTWRDCSGIEHPYSMGRYSWLNYTTVPLEPNQANSLEPAQRNYVAIQPNQVIPLETFPEYEYAYPIAYTIQYEQEAFYISSSANSGALKNADFNKKALIMHIYFKVNGGPIGLKGAYNETIEYLTKDFVNPLNITLSNQSVLSGQTVSLKAANNIDAMNYILSPSSNVELNAGHNITLSPGFDAQAGSLFGAQIIDWGTQPLARPFQEHTEEHFQPDSTPDTIAAAAEDKFELYQNTPNPFNPTTNISFIIPRANTLPSNVTIDAYNAQGRKIATIASGIFTAGKHSVSWDGNDSKGKPVPSGIYFYKICTGKHSASKRMILVR